MKNESLEYAGFWIRALATLIDTVLILLITMPLLIAIYGPEYIESEKTIHGPADFLLSWVFPSMAVIAFWIYKQATPGKMAIHAKIVDAHTGKEATVGQLIGRYFAYFLSSLPLGLGFLWVAFDTRKQGWHDKLAGTVVVRHARREQEPVRFSND